jgi:hypothetical protein
VILHELVIGDSAGIYLPFARSRLAALEAIDPTGVFTQSFVIGEYQIRVEQNPPFQFIRIVQGPGVCYEFFTSEHVNDSALGTPGEINGLADTFVCGSASRTAFGLKSASSVALYSSALTPPTPGDWPVLSCSAPQSKATGLYTWPAWQNQKFFEHTWHPNNDGKSLVTSTQAQAPGLAGQCNWMSPYNFARVASAGSKVSDFGPDVRPTYYKGSSILSGAPTLDQEWIYWRRAAVQTDPASGRQFFIATDSYGRFQVYPVLDYSATGYQVAPSGYKQYTPPYPGWVSVPDPTDYTRQVNDWLWRFNKDGTKCVSVPYSSDFSSGFSKSLYNEQFFATLTPALVANVDPAYANAIVAAHEDIPGLVEFGIAITVVGPGDMDFTVAFTLLRNTHFSLDGRFIFDAAYYFPDVEHVATDPAYIAEDTLMTAEVTCQYPAGYYTANSGELPPLYLDLAANVQGSIVVNANDAAMVPTAKLTFPAFNGGSAKFATVNGYGGGYGPGPIGGYVTYAVGGSTYTGSAGPVTYTPPSPPFTPGTYGATLAYLYALELATLSAIYEVDDQVAGTGYIRGIAYGTEFFRSDYSLGYTHPAPPWPVPDTVMPSARWYQYLLDSTLNTEWGAGFSAHPAGHWACAINAELGQNVTLAAGFDVISVKQKYGPRVNYTHKDLFNKAFKQTRDYTFYTTHFTGEGLWDQGNFRTQGIWVTFR